MHDELHKTIVVELAIVPPMSLQYHIGMFINSFSAYLWGEVAPSDQPPSRNRESNFSVGSQPTQNSSQIQMQQRKKAQSQMRKVHIEMWRENVRRSKQIREGSPDDDDKIKKLHKIETLYMRELSRQLKYGQVPKGIHQNSPAAPCEDADAPAVSVDEVEDDYVLLVCPN